jgi:hypothetical protein
VLALIARTDIVVAIPTVADVLATAEAQRVAAAPTSEVVSATVAVDRVGFRAICSVDGPRGTMGV